MGVARSDHALHFARPSHRSERATRPLEGRETTRSSPLFVDDRGQRWTTQRLSTIWARLRKQAGINPRCRLYDARHRFGTLVTSKHGIARAADLMGHSNIATTKRYDHANEDDLRDIQNSL